MDIKGIVDLGRQVAVDLSESQARLLGEHLETFLEANEHLNLTAIRDRDEALRLHLQDSLAAVHDVITLPEGPLLDLGSGGGYPGIPFAVLLGRDVTLLDSVKKKAAFLEAFIQREGLAGAVVVSERAEEYALEHTGEFSIVTARAVGQLGALVELASPLLKIGGCLLAMKGRPTPEEIDTGARVGKVVGMELVSTRAYHLPRGEDRTNIVFRKIRQSRVPLPRRAGMAQKRPLG